MRIAIAEGDPAAADLLVFVAQRRGHQAVCVSHPGRLLDRLPFQPTVTIISLPEIDDLGVEAVARLHESEPSLPIIVVTERPGANGALRVLRAGARDVVASPYNPHEVLARAENWVEAHSAVNVATQGVRVGDLEIDLEAYSATKHGRELTLTRLERRLLYCLADHHPNLATIDRLLTFGWEALEDPDAGLLKTHISHIRRKLREAGGTPFEIVSHQTVGYSLRVAEAALAS